jgi:hypothetical protein
MSWYDLWITFGNDIGSIDDSGQGHKVNPSA